jgi:hypothetical protein
LTCRRVTWVLSTRSRVRIVLSVSQWVTGMAAGMAAGMAK